MSTILEVAGISKAFGSLKVIDDFDFELAEGEALGIIGPNGAGKSTLFNLITGSLHPNSGSIMFEGVDITLIPAYRLIKTLVLILFMAPTEIWRMR